MPQPDFIRVETPQVHFERRKQILAAHPEVKDLAGPNRKTALVIVGVVALQLGIGTAVALGGLPWWAVLLLAYVVGAPFGHGLYVLIHECTHNLVARSERMNKVLAILCDVALGFPGAIAFRKYHLIHHLRMGEPDLDADMAAPWEGRLVKNVWWRKTLWMLFFSVAQALRPSKTKAGSMVDFWFVLNALVVFATDTLLVLFVGPWALVYILLSMFFGLGLHPLGGRWIQEHYVTTPGQETYSYYGPANRIAFNVGYHNEHHDFMNVAWNNLPKIKSTAPEFYDTLASYRSWAGVLWRFLFDPQLSPWSRIAHPKLR